MVNGKLYGRKRIVELVGVALKRKGVPGRPLPIVLCVGPHGSGGTALLHRLWDEFAKNSPSVLLDLESAQDIDDVVFAAMHGLHRKIPGIRRIHFPRLALALKTVSLDEDVSGQREFEEYLQQGERTARTRSTLDTMAQKATQLLTTPDQRLVAGIIANAAGWVYAGVKHGRDAQILNWFARNGISRGGSRYDPLWELYRWRHEQTDDASRKVDKTLCAAFLADLRTDFNDSRILHGQRTTNCLLLVDNAEVPVGRRFLEIFDECRRESVTRDESHDPVVVVAFQRGRPNRNVGEPVRAIDVRPPDDTSKDDHPNWWYPVRLTSLGHDDVHAMTKSSVLGKVRRDAELIHALTDGHPEATARLSTVLSVFGSSRFDPRHLLDAELPKSRELPDDWPGPTGDTGATVEDLLLRQAFPSELEDGQDGVTGSAVLNAMALCAITPGLRQGACQAALKFLGWPGIAVEDARERLIQSMWADEPADASPPRLHPLARLLLVRWLARDAKTWREVHEGYVNHYIRDPRDAPLLNHHRLALVETPQMGQQLATVVSYLEEEYERCTAPEWLRVLDTVTGAPNRIRETHHPITFITAIAGKEESGDRRRVITRLTVARWLYNDRCFDPSHKLAKLVADEYFRLGKLKSSDDEVFFTESTRYSRAGDEWKG